MSFELAWWREVQEPVPSLDYLGYFVATLQGLKRVFGTAPRSGEDLLRRFENTSAERTPTHPIKAAQIST